MAKRVRGKRSSAYRPGGQGPGGTKEPASGTASTAASADIDAAIAGAEPVDGVMVETAEMVVEEPARATRRRRAGRRGARAKADSLEVRAAAEEGWVREDLRHIGMITAGLVAGLVVAWILFVQLNLANLY